MNSQVFKQYLTQMSFNQELVHRSAFVVLEQRTFILAPPSLQSQVSLSLPGDFFPDGLGKLAGIAAMNAGCVSMQRPCSVSACRHDAP